MGRVGPAHVKGSGWSLGRRACGSVVVWAALGSAALAVAVSPAAAPLVPGAVVAWRVRARRAGARRARDAVVDLLPDLVDLLRVATEAGCTPAEAVAAVQRRVPEPACSALGGVLRSFERGASLADSLSYLPVVLGDPARPLAAGLARALRDGTPMAQPLERIGWECRAARRRLADVRTRRLPVVLVFPLVLCTLPAFALLTVAPLLLTSLRSLQL